MRKFRLSGFTLMEILIVVTIIVILATIIFAGNIQGSFQKARDSNRKQDLAKLQRVLEDYFNDKGDYPPANDPTDGQMQGASWGSSFTPYVPQMPKDPLSPARDYYYQVNQGITKFYVIYAKLENLSDADIVRVGCQDGCGPIGPDGKRAYNYFVSSTNVILLAGIPPGFDPGLDPTHAPAGPTTTPTSPAASPTPTSLSPTPTPTAPPATPTPTLNLTPPPSPNDVCTHNQCCLTRWCGAPSTQEGGKFCVQNEKCMYNTSFGWWECACATQSCNAPEPACP